MKRLFNDTVTPQGLASAIVAVILAINTAWTYVTGAPLIAVPEEDLLAMLTGVCMLAFALLSAAGLGYYNMNFSVEAKQGQEYTDYAKSQNTAEEGEIPEEVIYPEEV